jgi:hypothetical protein
MRPGAGDLPALAPGRPRARLERGPMTLLRRAPREVYRVYSEDEFLSDTTCQELSRTFDGAARTQRRHRLASATLLLAAAGAIGGLVVLTSVESLAGGRRREHSRPTASSGSLAVVRALRTSVWLPPRTARSDRPARGSASRPTGQRNGRALALRAPKRTQDVAASSELARVHAGAPAAQSPAVEVAASAGAQSPVAAAASEPGRAEFGFER